MPKLARRMETVLPSATIAVKQEADRLRSRGIDVIDFGPGEPDFNAPEEAKAAAVEAIRRDMSHYLPTLGLPALRAAVAEDYGRRHGTDYDAEEVMITCGGKNALFAAVMALFDRGDEVMIPAPYWVSFPEQVRLAGASPVFLPTREDRGFVPDVADAARRLTPATKGIILCSPSNPTGAIIPEEDLTAWADLAVERDLYLIFDECYEHFIYTGKPHASLARHAARLRDRLVLASTFSKSYAMTGYRVGYAVADRRLLTAMATIQSHDATHATGIAQAAALAALTGPRDGLAAMVAEYRKRRDLMVEGLRAVEGVTCLAPPGAFYVFPGVAGLRTRLGADDSQGVARALIARAGVAVVPGEAFGMEGYVRFSYALSADRIAEGLRRLKEAVNA